jgi:hypothetical protein
MDRYDLNLQYHSTGVKDDKLDLKFRNYNYLLENDKNNEQ